jgi:hypothetical protein
MGRPTVVTAKVEAQLAVMLDCGITHARAATALNISTRTISRFAARRREAKAETLEELLDVARSYSSPSQYSTVGPGLANTMFSSSTSLARTLPVSRYSMISPGIIEESMSTRIGESVRLMI